MEALLSAMKDTPISTILIVAGLLFLLLGLVNKIGGFVEVSPEQKRWTFPIGFVVLAIGLVLFFNSHPLRTGEANTATTPALQAATKPPGGSFAIVNARSNLCLSPVSEGTGPNDEIVQVRCDEHAARIWQFIEPHDDIVKVLNENSKLCLTVAGGNTFQKTPSVQYHCDSDASRRWKYKAGEGKKVRLINLNSSLCLTIAGGGTEKNARAAQQTCDEDPSQMWILKPH